MLHKPAEQSGKDPAAKLETAALDQERCLIADVQPPQGADEV